MNRDTNPWNNRNLGRRNRSTNNRSKLQSTPSDSATSKTWPSRPGSYGQYLSRTQSPSIRYPQAYSSSWIPPTHPWSTYTTWSYPYGNQQYNTGQTGNYGTERSNTGYGSYGVNNSSQETRPQDTSSKIDTKTDIKPTKCGALPPGAPPASETQLSPPQTEPAASSSSGYASLQSSAGQSPPSTSSTGQSPDSKSSLELLPSASGVQRNGSGIRSGRPPEITKIDLDDDDDDVCVVETAGVTAAVKTEDVKPAMDCIDLSEDGNCPEEILNRFHYEARTKILQQLCATFDETGFLEALKQLKLLLEKQRAEVKMKCDLMQLLTRFLLFLGSNYSSIGTVFVEEYLELMEDVIVHYCEVVREYMLVQLERKKRRNLKRLGTRIKFVMARCLLYRMDSIMHCLFRVQLYPGEQEHCFLWTDIFIYFLKRVKYEPKDDDVVRAYIGWQKMKTIRSAADADLIDDVMCMQLGKELEEMKKIPCLKEILDAKQADSRYDVRDMLTRYWRWWKEERPREPWTDLEEPTVMELPGRPDLELAAFALSTSSSTKTVDEVARLLEDRRSGRNPGLIQQAAQKREPKTTGAFSPSIFDDDDISLCVEDSDGDDDDVIIESITKRPEEVVVVLSDSDGDDDGDDIVFVEPEEPSEAPAEAPVEPVAAEPDEVAADEPVAEKAAAVVSEPMEEVTEEPPSQVDSDIASEKPPPIAPEEPKAPKETKGIFDDSDDDDFEEPIVPEKPSDNQSTREETLSEPLPSSNNWTDWDDQWAQLEEKPVPYLLEFMERPETPDEDCEDKVTAPPIPPKRYSIFEKPAPFESWCSETLEFGSSDEETEPAATPRAVSEDNSSITIKHEQLSEECASESSQNVNKDDLVPEEDEAVAGEPEIALDDGDEAKESVETTAAAVEQNTEEFKDFENDKTEDVPQETVEENASQQPENSDVNVAPEEATEAADAAGESIEESPVVPSDVIEDDKREDTVDEAATENATASDEAENLPKPHEDATISSSDATEIKKDDSCVTEPPQQPDEPQSSKNAFSVRSLVIEIEKLPPTKPSNGETTVAMEEDEDIGFNLADININGFSSDDDDDVVGDDYRQSTMVEGGEASQRDGLGLGISPISKVAVEAGESLKTEDVLQSDKDSNTQDTHNVSKPQNSSCSSDSCNNLSYEMLDKVEVQHHFDAAARKHLGMLSPNSKITDCSTSISDLSSLSTTLSTDLSSSVEKPMNARDPRLAGQSDVAKRYKQSLDESASTNRLAVNGWNESVMDATVINCNEVGSKDDQVVDATVICNNEDGASEAVPAAEAHSLVDLYTNFAKEVSVEAQETDASTNNTDNVIMLQCSNITKEDAATAVPPVSLLLTPDRAFDDQHFNNDKQMSASSYEILMPQGGYSENIPLSGSQPCSPQNSPDTRTNGAVQENSAILYHPILKQYPGLKPAVVPKQDALKMTNNNTTEAVNFVKMPSPQKAKPAPVPQPLSIFGSKFGNKDRQEAPRKGRRRSTAESRKKDANKSPKHITAEDESDLFQNALEGPTGKPLRNSGGNMFWDESDDAAFKGSSISVKADSQLKNDAQLKNNAQLRRSILKTSSTRRKAVKFALSNENEIKACKNPADLDPRFHEAAVIKINDRDIISKSIMQRYMEMRAEERRRLKLQQEAHKRALERAQMMELNEQQQHRQDNNIVYYIFSDKWDKKDKHLIPKCSSYAPRVRFKGKTDDHNHGNHRNGERPPEKRKRSEHTSDAPAKRVRITVPEDLAEKEDEEEAPELERDRPNGVSHHRKSKMSARPIAMERKSKNAASEFTATTKHSLMGKKAKINPVLASNGVDLMENGSTSSQTKSGRLRHKPSGKDYYDVTKRTTGRRKTTHQF